MSFLIIVGVSSYLSIVFENQCKSYDIYFTWEKLS